MTRLDKLYIWYLANKDKFVTIIFIMIFPMFFLFMNNQYDKEKSIDYNKYSGTSKLISLDYKELYGTAMYGDSKPVLNGINVKFEYFVNDIKYSNTIFVNNLAKSKIKSYIYKNQKDSLEVCYNIINPKHSELKIKQRKFDLDIRIDGPYN